MNIFRIIPVDKLLHVLVCAAVTATCLRIYPNWLLSLGIVAIIGYAKEKYDELHPDKHTKDWWDFFAGLVGWAITLLIYRLLFSGVLL